jgi:hypothetical protein
MEQHCGTARGSNDPIVRGPPIKIVIAIGSICFIENASVAPK